MEQGRYAAPVLLANRPFGLQGGSMHHLTDLLHNALLVNAVLSWALAQLLKTVVYAVANRRFEWERLLGDGGWPSGHSATVASMAMASALIYGTGSFQFAITMILAIIVCHDAMGVRLETGKQAIVINEIVESLLDANKLPEVKLKEFVGHTPIQVTIGILIGILNAAAMYYLLFA